MKTRTPTPRKTARFVKKSKKSSVKAARRSTHRKVVHATKKASARKPIKMAARREVMKVKVEKRAKAINNGQPHVEIVPNIANIANLEVIEEAINDENFSNYVARGIGKRAKEIIKLLATPQTDDVVAEKLNIKINEVRRMLNMLNTYGVARYNVNKDSRGWLTFKWYIDSNKLGEMRNEVVARSEEGIYKIPESCNDFFLCEKCYSNQKTIFPFETAFEMDFRCDDCGTAMVRVNKDEVANLVVQREGKLI